MAGLLIAVDQNGGLYTSTNGTSFTASALTTSSAGTGTTQSQCGNIAYNAAAGEWLYPAINTAGTADIIERINTLCTAEIGTIAAPSNIKTGGGNLFCAIYFGTTLMVGYQNSSGGSSIAYCTYSGGSYGAWTTEVVHAGSFGVLQLIYDAGTGIVTASNADQTIYQSSGSPWSTWTSASASLGGGNATTTMTLGPSSAILSGTYFSGAGVYGISTNETSYTSKTATNSVPTTMAKAVGLAAYDGISTYLIGGTNQSTGLANCFATTTTPATANSWTLYAARTVANGTDYSAALHGFGAFYLGGGGNSAANTYIDSFSAGTFTNVYTNAGGPSIQLLGYDAAYTPPSTMQPYIGRFF
jgi:hypothetical protein